MKAFMALLCLCPLVCGAATLTTAQVWVCPGPAFPSKCAAPVFAPPTSTFSAASVSKATPVWAHSVGGYADSALLVVCPLGAVLSTDSTLCTNAAGTDARVLLLKSAVTNIPAVQTRVYVLTWSPVTTRVDGTALTDLTGYIAQTGPSLSGPWGMAQTVTVTTASFGLPSNVQPCFQVVAVSASGSSDPARICAPAAPSAPSNVTAN